MRGCGSCFVDKLINLKRIKMVLSETADEDIRSRYQELCGSLNMDRVASEEAWNNYEVIRHNYTLEGDQLHWLGCALYVACRRAVTPTVGKAGTIVEGNCVSLTRLLRLCKLSLIQFFSKSKKWADMASMPAEFRVKLDKLERNFAVSMVIFKKFQPIYVDLFTNPTEEQSRVPRSRKIRGALSTPTRVFDFSWALFVCVKSDLPDVSDDLVNSFHLLLACCDFVYGNAVMAKRRDLLNPDFPGLPAGFLDESFVAPTQPQCVIDYLCTKHDGIPLEAKGIKEYCWKINMRKLFIKKLIKGEINNLSGILDSGNFEFNWKSINKTYEEYVLSEGDFDERIFLAEDSASEIGTPAKLGDDFDERMKEKKNTPRHCTGIKQLTHTTPLTGRKYLKAKEHQSNVTPVSTATQSVSRLQAILAGRHNSPSDMLKEIFKTCSRDPLDRVEERVKEIGTLFCTRYSQNTDETPGSNIDFARKRLTLAENLYYKLLENILVDEKKKKPEGFDFTQLLEQDIFHQTMFACSLEIVIYSYNSQRTFPWVLEALNLEPYYFYKVIEVIIRIEDQLSRDMVKHLNLIEEQILEALAWKTDSPLWEVILKSGTPVPSCEDVCLPYQLEDNNMTTAPCPNPAIRRLIGPGPAGAGGSPQSPVTSATDRFQSPVTTGLNKNKRLTVDGSTVRVVRPGQSVLQQPKPMTVIQTVNGEFGEQYIPLYVQPGGSMVIQAQTATQEKKEIVKPKRAGSLALFFRKFYHLASVRMTDLCSHLNIIDAEIKRKIWTCFEHSIMGHTTLMQDRHLDQLLMCAIYVVCKICQHERTFTEIMRCYRLQPQYASHVYRSVLLRSKRSGSSGTSSNASPTPSDCDIRDERVRSSSTLPSVHSSSAPPTPTHLAGTATSFEFEDRGDLIKFYNTVYVQLVQTFALKFSAKGQNENLTLSPLPLGKNQPMSPRGRRVSENRPVFIRTLEPQLSSSPSQQLSYLFSRSPAKVGSYGNLRAINDMIQVDARKVGKRLLVDDVPEADSPPAKVVKKLQDIMGERRGQVPD